MDDSPKFVKKIKPDWDAVERDYRTGQFTLRELAARHNVNFATISRHAEKEAWTKDLTEAIRQATNAKLIQQASIQACNDAQQSATNTVLAVAELNKQVILSHRNRLTELADAVDFAKNILIKVGGQVTEVKDASMLVQAVNGLSNATKTLIDKERENYKLNEAPPDDRERESAIAGMLAAIGRSSFPVAK